MTNLIRRGLRHGARDIFLKPAVERRQRRKREQESSVDTGGEETATAENDPLNLMIKTQVVKVNQN